MPPIVTKRDLLDYMGSLHACLAATEWVTAQEGSAREIWERCERVDWLIWLGGRRNPRAVAWFAQGCADAAKQYTATATYAYAANYAAADAAACAAADAANYAATYAYAAADAATCAYAASAADAASAAERARQLQVLRSMWGKKGNQS